MFASSNRSSICDHSAGVARSTSTCQRESNMKFNPISRPAATRQAYSNISFHLSLCANVGQSRPFLRKLLTGETALAGSAMAGPQTFAVAGSVFGDLRM